MVPNIQKEIQTFQNEYERYLMMARDASVKIQDRQYTLAGLECAIDKHTGDSEVMEYFMCNKNLSLIGVTGTAIEFVSHGYADMFDAEAFERFVSNHGSYMYSQLHPTITKPQMEKLYRSIFGEEVKYKLRLCAAYTADMKTGLKPIREYTFPPESSTYLANPHIQNFGCVGGYAARFQEYLKKRDYVGAIDQAVVSARNLNFYDSPVIMRLAHNLSHTATKCLERPDGTLLTPREAINELEGGVAECHDPLF